MKTVGTKLRKLREEKGLLLREVGAKLSIDPTILSKIERDERKATKTQIEAFCRFYKVRDEIYISWLSDKLVCEVKDDEFALQAMQVAEEKIKYNKSLKK